MIDYFFYTYFTHIFTFWSLSSIFIYIDFNNLFQDYRLRKNQIDKLFYKETIKDVINTHVKVMLPFNLIIAPSWDYFGCTWDSPNYSIFHILFILLIEELLFFYLHYIFHKNKYLFKKIHYKHHKWKEPVAVSALYAHPVENILCNFLPLLIGIYITKLNFYYVIFMIAFVTTNAVLVHSGYNFRKKINNHYKHHKNLNKQFGILGIFDRIYKTN